ncbi:MAG: serine hydrolase [Kordiimonadaceae bacterium]|jgi:CubicO group peptidase (beta-lactamase class C family)|nr:serine hydrolase [Kordiimonadaceae bacterium]
MNKNYDFSKRQFLVASSRGALALGLSSLPLSAFGQSNTNTDKNGVYFPPPEAQGGWRKYDANGLSGIDTDKLTEAIHFHDNSPVSTSRGAALLIIHKGKLIGESYVTGKEGGPDNWTAKTCNDMKSSTKSVFGTGVGVFLDQYKKQVNLETLLVGNDKESSLIPQIWDQPITDEAKKRIKVKHVLSMTSGHAGPEPWLGTGTRQHHSGYHGAYQMHEYCFGWWNFEGVASHETLLFEPGNDFMYSNFGMEQMALAIRNVSGQDLGPYTYDKVLGPIGMPIGLRDNRYRDMPYSNSFELNFAETPGWGVGGDTGCDAYGADGSDSPYGINSIAGSTFRCTARDFARLAYLWLNNGRWMDEQLVPEAWLKLATKRFQRDDGSTPNNYGYTFWVIDDLPNVPNDLYMSRGHNQNHSYIIPSMDLVVVRQGNDNRREVNGASFQTELIQKVTAAIIS